MGVNLDNLYDEITESIKSQELKTTNIYVRKLKLPFSDEVKLAFKLLDKESEGVGFTVINTSHILLALLTFPKLHITKILKTKKVTHTTFKNKIMELSNGFKENIEVIKNSIKDDGDDLTIGRGKNENQTIKNETKTPALDNFCRDITKDAKNGKLDQVIGRAKEIKRVSQILARRKKNNPVLIGEPGVGKCFSSDTEVVIKNDLTGEVFKIKIEDLLKRLPTPS